MKNHNNFMDFISFFSTDEIFYRFLESILWKEEKVCCFCDDHRVIEYSNFKENNKRLLIYLINSDKKCVSSIQLGKQIDDKSITMEMIKRNKVVKTQQLKNITAKTLLKYIYNNVEENSLLTIDELQSYKSMEYSYK